MNQSNSKDPSVNQSSNFTSQSQDQVVNPWVMLVAASDPPEKIDFEAIKARVNFPQVVKQEWGVNLEKNRCACKFHPGSNPESFSIKDNQAHCFSCGWSGDVFDFLANWRNITLIEAARELDGQTCHSNGKAASRPPKGRIDKVYEYLDHEGKCLFQVVRLDPKGFRQRRPDGKEGWIWNLDGVETVLYHLPQLRDAEPGATFYIPEGEKDVERLHGLGLVATCNPMGAGKWLDRYAEHMHGHPVVILADNDEPGRNHANQVAQSCSGKAKSIKLITFSDLPKKGDVSDFLQSHNLEDLLKLIETTPEWTLPKLVRKGSQIVAKDVEWLWMNRIPKRFITIFYGATDVGKSYVSHDITARITQGDEWPDSDGECVEKGKVLLISEDSEEYVLRPRLDALGADPDRWAVLTWEAMMSFTLDRLDLLEQAWIEADEPDLIVIDPPTSFLGARNENSNKEVRAVMMRIVHWLLKLKKPVACILIAHTKKPDGKSLDSIYRLLGSVAWGTTARVAHSFAFEPEDPTRCVFACAKINIGEKPKALNYRLERTEDSGKLAVVSWLGVTDTTSTESLNGETASKKLFRGEAAAAWVTNRFRENRLWPSTEFLEAAKRDGVSRDALFRSKEVQALPVRSKRIGGIWYWTVTDPKWPLNP